MVPVLEPCWACDEESSPGNLLDWPPRPVEVPLIILEPTAEEISALSL